jgi:hypothetical protein
MDSSEKAFWFKFYAGCAAAGILAAPTSPLAGPGQKLVKDACALARLMVEEVDRQEQGPEEHA